MPSVPTLIVFFNVFFRSKEWMDNSNKECSTKNNFLSSWLSSKSFLSSWSGIQEEMCAILLWIFFSLLLWNFRFIYWYLTQFFHGNKELLSLKTLQCFMFSLHVCYKFGRADHLSCSFYVTLPLTSVLGWKSLWIFYFGISLLLANYITAW